MSLVEGYLHVYAYVVIDRMNTNVNYKLNISSSLTATDISDMKQYNEIDVFLWTQPPP